MPHALIHADILGPDGLVRDSALVIDDAGTIAAVDPELLPSEAEVHDCSGAVVAPGIVDLHCDAIEKVVEPRPGARFPLEPAMDQVDRLTAAAGITTAFHAISFGQEARAEPETLAAGIAWLGGRSLVEHRLHCRYEIACERSLDVVRDLVAADAVSLISIMDHSPGQGQFKDIESFCAYYTRAHGLSHDQALALARQKHENRTTGHGRALELTEFAARAGIPVASHDDDTPERIAAVHATGITIAEFPITADTARAAKGHGMTTILGAPNILRGGSQSGSMRALDGVIAGTCDCLCADYAPWALLPAVLRLPELAAIDIAAAWRLVSANPARAAGLRDRGTIAPGARADLVVIDRSTGIPRLTATWCAGRLAHRAGYPAPTAVPA